VARIGGHNIVGFDLERVAAAFRRYGLFFPVDFRTVLDTRYGAVWHFEINGGGRPKDFKDFKLTGLAEHFGIQTDGAHDALADVRMTIALARKLVGK
jgi:DNA polymerase III epsilon subunit-like protein